MKRRQFLATGLASATLLFANRRNLHSLPFFPDEGGNSFTGKERFFTLAQLAKRERWREKSIPEIMGRVGMELRGTPYVGSTLELYDDREVCAINLMGLDCVTLFENALAFARLLKSGKELLPEEMMRVVTFTRYRGGKITDYTSRLHYTTDWFHDNQIKKVATDITKGLPGAERFTQVVNFMSTHPNSYRQLKANPALVPIIANIESEINAREMYYVPKEKVAAAESQLKTGDIVGITTTIKGIDCSHTGLCYRDDSGKLRLLHASLTKKEVTLDDELHAYLATVSKHTGIMVVRPMELA
ncbi:MAG: DUF1460 domain-containing protein [Armatimonadetes bacterium]|nr:DUF1460 domain-containing protein [Armatimonadota bacterium]